MPNLWNMTDEEISQLSDQEIGGKPSGYLWGDPKQMRQERVRETVREASRQAREGIRRRPPSRIVDAATGKVTMDPGGMERVHDAAQQGGLAAMIEEAGGDQELVTAAQEIEGVPGGMELMQSFAAQELMKAQGIPQKEVKKLKLYKYGGAVERAYARGGDVKAAAAKTRGAGRGDDTMMLHMSPEEYEVITGMWGTPDVNPKTGIGEYGFLSKMWKKVKKGVKKVFKSKIFQVLAPIALSVFMPGLGTAIGGMLLGGAGGATAASLVGNAVVQGGLGAITGGKEGAIKGALGSVVGGAAGAYGKGVGEAVGLTGKTADVVGSALIQGAGAEATGGDFTEGAIRGGLSTATRGAQDRMAEDVRGTLGLQHREGDVFASRMTPQGEPQMSLAADRPMTADELLTSTAEPVMGATPEGADVAQTRTPTTASPVTQADPTAPSGRLTVPQLAGKYAMPLAAAGLGALSAGQSGYEEGPPDWYGQGGSDPSFGESLPVYTMNRQFRGLPGGEADYFTYGQAGSPQSGQHLFMAPEPFAGEQGTPTAPQGGLQAAVGNTMGQQPVPAQSGLAGAAQRATMAAKGWQLNPQTNMYHPPAGGQPGQTAMVAEGGYMEDYWEQNADVPNAAPAVSREGGHHVRGPGSGRSDDIPAVLSDGEYVIDAESVALLGDGSGNEGARRLDQMRTELRKHKGKNLSKGGFSHKAKSPKSYMRNVRKLKRATKYEHGGTANVGGTSPLPPVQAQGRNV